MSDSERFPLGMTEQGRWVLEYVRQIPDIRQDKVTAARRCVDSGGWKAASIRVAEKILYEHLLDSTG